MPTRIRKTDGSWMDYLTTEACEEQKVKIALMKGTLPDALTMLSKDVSTSVRANVARNARTPVEVLINLTQDDNMWVRGFADKNPTLEADRAQWMQDLLTPIDQ